MIKTKILSVCLLVSILLSAFSTSAAAEVIMMETIPVNSATVSESANDYKDIYLSFAKDAENNRNNPLWGTVSGMILIDFNKDNVPELLTYSTYSYKFDKNGNEIFAQDEGYDNPAFILYEYALYRTFSIIDGKVVNGTPWDKNASIILMPYLPGEYVVDTEAYCDTVMDLNGEISLCMAPSRARYTRLAYTGQNFIYETNDGFIGDRGFYYSHDVPVATEATYCREKEQKRSYGETMELLIDKYENSVKEYMAKNVVSEWAKEDVAKAKELDLVPLEMEMDDMTEEITRAEFSAIAIKLFQALLGKTLSWHGGYMNDIDFNRYQVYIRGAYFCGLVKGTSETPYGTSFSPNDNVTREQLATILCRIVKAHKAGSKFFTEECDVPLEINNTVNFDDDSMISNYAREAVYYLTEQGVINGKDKNTFAPSETATKEQAIVLALRLYNQLNR